MDKPRRVPLKHTCLNDEIRFDQPQHHVKVERVIEQHAAVRAPIRPSLVELDEATELFEEPLTINLHVHARGLGENRAVPLGAHDRFGGRKLDLGEIRGLGSRIGALGGRRRLGRRALMARTTIRRTRVFAWLLKVFAKLGELERIAVRARRARQVPNAEPERKRGCK
eukprot:Amastigsp_a676559_9.p3 type:complete len:168 gc:universal Amastigsp_a676559_9:765-1268(+)